MKMNKAVAAVAAGMIAFGAMFSVSAAGIGYVNSNALLAAHPKMQKAQLDMRTAAQKAEETFKSRSAGKTDQEKQQIATELQKEMDRSNGPPCSRLLLISRKLSSRFARKRASTLSLNRVLLLTVAWM